MKRTRRTLGGERGTEAAPTQSAAVRQTKRVARMNPACAATEKVDLVRRKAVANMVDSVKEDWVGSSGLEEGWSGVEE